MPNIDAGCGLVVRDAMTWFLLWMCSLSNYTGDCDLEAPFWLACTHHTIWTISCALLLKCCLIRNPRLQSVRPMLYWYHAVWRCHEWCMMFAVWWRQEVGEARVVYTAAGSVAGSWDLLVIVSPEYRHGSHSDRPGGVTTVLQGGHRAAENRNLVATLMDQYHIVKTMSHVWRPVW